MNDTSLLNELNSMIEHYVARNGHQPLRIITGYKAYASLMSDSKFYKEVTNSALNPNKRKYKKIKIKVTKDDDQLELE
ncbi:hypothetical protein F900_02094 [Acinetobacter modestus]|uniref:Uncharacterized protein n=1 Tax=Acinetobacter modestus TaxID=1776740 RepID=N9LVQ2_9GAMM|nr:hypothetical protein [Acinetobacter modestus]ENX00423.1 hypothetical protein F900_02094 [Acinetobacter modestus]